MTSVECVASTMTDLDRLLEFLDNAKIPYFKEWEGYMVANPVWNPVIITEIVLYIFHPDGKYGDSVANPSLWKTLMGRKDPIHATKLEHTDD